MRRAALVLAVVGVAIATLIVARTATASGDTITTTLYPGWNLIGWIHDDRAAVELFDEIPGLEAIFDGDRRSAQRDLRESDWKLQELGFGKGYWFFVEAPSLILWQREAAPLHQVVQVERGVGAVAWVGGGDTPLADALVGLRPQLNIAWHWNASEQNFQHWIPYTKNPYRDGIRIDRGDAMLLNAKESRDWMHPTGELPDIEFPGGLDHEDVHENLRAMVEADLRYVIALVAGYGGVEVQPSRYVVRIPTTYEARVEVFGREYFGGQAKWAWAEIDSARYEIAVTAQHWNYLIAPDAAAFQTSGRYLLAHEYFHIVQFNLVRPEYPDVPIWIGEGTVAWIDVEPPGFWPEFSRELRTNILDLSLHEDRSSWHHDPALPGVAIDLLLDLVKRDDLLEFWRILGPQTPDITTWQGAFQRAFGLAVEEFYAYFYEQRRGLFTQIRGQVSGWATEPYDRLTIRATISEDPDLLEPPDRDAQVDSDGQFVLNLPRDQAHDLAIGLSLTSCWTPVNSNGEAAWTSKPLKLTGRGETMAGLTIEVPSRFCEPEVTVSFTGVGPADEELEQVILKFCTADGVFCVASDLRDGSSFSGLVPFAASYVIGIDRREQSCPSYLGVNSLVDDPQDAVVHAVGEEFYTLDFPWRHTQGICDLRLHGQVLGLPSGWHDYTRVYLWPDPDSDEGAFGYGSDVDAMGRFLHLVKHEGRYRLSLHVKHPRQVSKSYCEISAGNDKQWLSREGWARSDEGYMMIGRGMPSSLHWHVRPDACRWFVEGEITSSTGELLGRHKFTMCDDASPVGLCWLLTSDERGAIGWLAPFSGSFTLKPYGDTPPGETCFVIAGREFWRQIVIDGSDVDGIRWVAPERVCA